MNTKVVSGGVVFLHVHFFFNSPELKQNSLTFPRPFPDLWQFCSSLQQLNIMVMMIVLLTLSFIRSSLTTKSRTMAGL